MDDHFIDFIVILLILIVLIIATVFLLVMYSKPVKRFLAKLIGRPKKVARNDVEAKIAPKRTTIRIVKSLDLDDPKSPPFRKQSAKRVLSNPPPGTKKPMQTPLPTPTSASSPSQKCVFVFPKNLSYQMTMTPTISQSKSTNSSYLPTAMPVRRCST
ncbi:unnamed protein product [Caenorhabditis bovis]|uniref:Uncharacterized protein n=1 Tax=Caenorhabditis bovis TaxID=2654633 RepID=A0A8S1F7F7_9PELO|nr:unnamed protein product [Caenorhabditis bovis]